MPKLPDEAAEMRRLAEEQLREQHPEGGATRSSADTERLVHELQVHQIELEMQNEELQKARDEMEAALEKYSDLFDFAPVGYLTLDREGFIREANLTLAGFLGIERSRLLKWPFDVLVSPDSRANFKTFVHRVFEGKARATCAVTLLKDGRRPVEVRIEARVAASGRECRAVLEDLTEIRRAEQDRLILNKLESTGILAGGIAHDFNNLLAVILLNLDLAQRSVGTPTEMAELLEEVKNGTLAARGLTQQLMAFAGGAAPLRKVMRLSGIFEESVRAALSGSRVCCKTAVAEDLWAVEVDEGQIGQVVRNLVLNAREAMPEGGVITLRAENVVLGASEPTSLPPGDYVRVSITDEGGGIAKEVLPKIFDPYFSTKQRGSQKGMGLGLTICHTVIQKHAGAIAVESEAGVGTTFHFLLPASGKPSAGEPTVAREQPLRQGKILVMDDEEAVRKVMGALLKHLGHEVVLVEDGQRAIEVYEAAMAQGRPFDLAFLDLTVRAGVGGQEAIQALLRANPGVKAVLMSGYSQDLVVLKPERYGFKGALAKPFQTHELRAVLARTLGTRESERSLVGHEKSVNSEQ